MTPIFFTDQKEFRKWLEENHSRESELLAGYYKVGSGKPGMTWSQSVDEALCFGWIDGIRRSIDSERYCIRFTPRKPSSNWSAVNLKKVEQLTEKGLMKQSGLDVYNKRKKANSEMYVVAVWPALKNQISGGLNLSLCGIPYWNSDIGGFFLWLFPKRIQNPTYVELYVRWLQFGNFCPMMRSHGTDAPREIYQFGEKGSWAYKVPVIML